MHIEHLGELTQHPNVEEWMQSVAVEVKYFGGQTLPFVLENLAGDAAPVEFSDAVARFLNLTTADREVASKYVFKNYTEFCRAVGDEDVGVRIASAQQVWDHVKPTCVYVKRRRANKKVYVLVAAECGWEQEHGLQLVFREGQQLSRVSSQDGHLTHCDAYGLPDSKDRIC
ncbi:MAG TPA: hypothetical protein VGP72_26380 [Planctomycetota bacterium]|jgi:hypothetical protein